MFEAAWWALSKDSRKKAWIANGRKRLGFLERAQWTLAHANDIDPVKFIRNLAGNQVGDLVGGLSGEAWKKSLQNIWKFSGGKLDLRGRGIGSTFNRLPGV